MTFFLGKIEIIPKEFQFDWLDWTVIIIYFIGLIYMSVRLGEGQESQEDYYVGGRDLPWWAVGLSTMATQTSAISFASIPAFVAIKKGGGLQWIQYEFAVPLAMIFIMVFFIPFFRQLELISVYRYMEDRFGKASRYLLAGIFLVSRGLATAVGLFMAALILTVCFNVELWITIILIGVITLIYDTIGGMKAVVYSDVVQMGILMLGIFFCSYYALKDIGGFAEAFKVFPKERLVSIDNTWGFSKGEGFPFWGYLIGGFFLYSSYYGCDQSQTQRELSAPTLDDTKKSLFFNGFFRFPLTILYMIMGILIGAYIVKNADFGAQVQGAVSALKKPDIMLPYFMMVKIPHGIKALIFSALLAAAMSSLDSAINSLSASTMQDFVEKFVDLGNDNKKYLFYSRATTVFWGTIITLSAFLFKKMEGTTVVEAINQVGSTFYGPILASFLVGVSIRRVNQAGLIAGMIAGVAVNVLLWQLAPQVFWMWWNLTGCVVAIVVSYVVSLMTAEPDYEKVDKLIIWNSPLAANEKKWIPKYAVLVVYFFIMLAVAYYLPKFIAGFK